MRSFAKLIFLGGLLLSACTSTSTPLIQETENPTPVQVETETINESQPSPDAISTPGQLEGETPPIWAEREFSTDFSKHSVPYGEILTVLPKDGIPAIDDPKFVAVPGGDTWLRPQEPVILVIVGAEARAYPIQILMWHEIVNDTVGGLPLAVTFCPLCNTAIIFERTHNGQVLDFGTTGRLRYSNLIMYDRQTETWWQQANGEAVAGELTGAQLAFYPGSMISWGEFKNAYPDGLVLSRQTGFVRAYGNNPYIGYDDINSSPFLYTGPETPGMLPAVARVLTIDLNGEAVAYPYTVLEEVQVVNDVVGRMPVVVFWAAGTASALDREAITTSRDVGAAVAYDRDYDGRVLNFQIVGSEIVDQETGTTWNVLGQAVAGELAGAQLSPVVSINHFWFSWAAFKPETRIYQPSDAN
jgi:hypothetical protein